MTNVIFVMMTLGQNRAIVNVFSNTFLVRHFRRIQKTAVSKADE